MRRHAPIREWHRLFYDVTPFVQPRHVTGFPKLSLHEPAMFDTVPDAVQRGNCRQDEA